MKSKQRSTLTHIWMMTAFNKNLTFPNEPQLNDAVEKCSLETIVISENISPIQNYRLTLKTSWFPLSGQEARYHSAVPFHEASQTFSWGLEIKDVLSLVWDAKKREIHYSHGEHYSPERLRFWVLHTFLPLVLELERSYHIVHVGAVEVEGNPILFSAFSFGGKSTR